MKGALAIMLELFREHRRKNPDASLALLVTSDEETGGDAGVRHLFDDLGFRCGTVLVPDGGSLTEITIEEKGLLQIEMIIRGHTAHAARPWLAQNELEREPATNWAICAGHLNRRQLPRPVHSKQSRTIQTPDAGVQHAH